MIKSLYIKNFRSFPNCETTISFTEGINLIEGTNGSGKSTITNALLWGIWGKCNYKKGDITNVSTNGECWVKVVIILAGDIEMVIERTMKSLEICYAGEKLSFPSLAAANAFIVKKIGMRYNVASFLMTFSGESCISAMTPAKRREIVEVVMGMDIIHSVNDKAKAFMNASKNNIEAMKSLIAGYKQNIDSIVSVVEGDTKNEQEEIDKINESLAHLKTEYESYTEKQKAIAEILNDLRSKMVTLGNEASVLQSKRDDLIYRATTIKNMNVCPTCMQAVTDAIKETIINGYHKEYNDVDIKWNDSKVKYEDLQQQERDATDRHNENTNMLSSIATEINNLRMSLAILNRNLSVKAASSDTIAKINKDIAELQAKLDEDTRRYEIMSIIYDKTKKDADCILQVVGTHLDLISTHASNIIGTKISFNPDYSITATGRNMDISVLSSGEQKKVDFAIKLALLDTFMTTSSEVNVCFIDESLANVDIYAICDIVKLLRKYTHRRHIGMYIVHHAQLDDTLFDSALHISKASGYSMIDVTRNYIG